MVFLGIITCLVTPSPPHLPTLSGFGTPDSTRFRALVAARVRRNLQPGQHLCGDCQVWLSASPARELVETISADVASGCVSFHSRGSIRVDSVAKDPTAATRAVAASTSTDRAAQNATAARSASRFRRKNDGLISAMRCAPYASCGRLERENGSCEQQNNALTSEQLLAKIARRTRLEWDRKGSGQKGVTSHYDRGHNGT